MPDFKHEAEDYLSRLVDSGLTRGGVVLLGDKDGVHTSVGLGGRDSEDRFDWNEASIFRIYSMSKLLTSIVALRLVRQGLLDLEEDIASFLKETEMGIRVRHLLTHTSGIGGGTGRHGEGNSYDAAGIAPYENRPDQHFTTETLARALLKIPKVFKPGSGWLYGRSHDFLGFVLEQVSGRTLDTLYDEVFGEPLEAASLGFEVRAKDRGRVVPPWSSSGDAPQGLVEDRPKLLSGGSGAYCSALDYFKILNALVNSAGHLGIGSAHYAELWANQIGGLEKTSEDFIPGSGFGFSFGVATQQGTAAPGTVIWWLGRAGTSFIVDRDTGLIGVAMLQNYGNARRLQKSFHAFFDAQNAGRSKPSSQHRDWRS